MATSGSSNFNNTTNEIIQSALRKCGILAEGETASAQMVTDARGDLNRLVKGWAAIGLKIWARQELVLFLDTTTQRYEISVNGAECTVEEDLVSTTVASDAVSGASSIDLSSSTGIATGDRIGIVQDDGTLLWTTLTLSGLTATLADVTTAAVTAGNEVYSYTDKAPRPSRITAARVRNSSGYDVPLRKLSHSDYFNMSNKGASGVPNSFYYHPKTSVGYLYVWPVTDSVLNNLRLTAERIIEDFDSASDNPDLPQEWLQPLIWNLAREVMLEYGVDEATKGDIRAAADYWKGVAESYDVDDTSVIFMPDIG